MMSRFILISACGLTLSACASYLPNLPGASLLRPTPATEVLRIDSNPSGADATISEGPMCRTPCEFTVPSGSDLVVTVAMSGYRPVTVPVRPESSGGQLQPNPVVAELQPVAPPASTKKPTVKKNPKRASPAQSAAKKLPSMAGA
jgi:PEGA domain-containing protein